MNMPRRHDSRPAQRCAFAGLALASCLVACLGSTTSLGGADSDASSASASSDDAGTGTVDPGADAGSAMVIVAPEDASSPPQSNCFWYVWTPVPTTTACEYFLPSPLPDPGFDPATWDPHNVRIEFGAKYIGLYTVTIAGCGSTDGWYYADSDGQAPTRFMLCPGSCARIAGEGSFLRLAAQSCH